MAVKEAEEYLRIIGMHRITKKVQSFLIICLNLLIHLVIILQIHNNRIKQEVTGNERKQT